VRAYAAGYLHKQEILSVTGPYAYTRNPLYLGSAVLALGAGIAMRSWISADNSDRLLRGVLFHRDGGAKRMNSTCAMGHLLGNTLAWSRFFIPRLTAAKLPGDSTGSFSLAQYRKNHEWQAARRFLFLLFVLLLRWRFPCTNTAAFVVAGQATKQVISSACHLSKHAPPRLDRSEDAHSQHSPNAREAPGWDVHKGCLRH